MDEELQKILKSLRLWGLLAQWDELLAEAQRGHFSHERLLKHVLQAEARGTGWHAGRLYLLEMLAVAGEICSLVVRCGTCRRWRDRSWIRVLKEIRRYPCGKRPLR